MALNYSSSSILPFHTKLGTEASLSYLIISPGKVPRTKLIDALENQRQRQLVNYKLNTHACENLKQVLSCTDIELQVDFIILVIEPEREDCLDQIEASLNHLDTAFFFGRVCLVLKAIASSLYKVSHSDIRQFKDKYRCHLLVINDVDNPGKWIALAEQISNVASAACGLKTGMAPHVGLSLF